MKSNKITLSTIGAATLALSFAACSSAPATNTATNKANTAVVTNANSAATTTNAAANATASNAATSNAASSANTGSATGGDTITIEQAGIAVTAPKGFKIEKDGETTNLISPDDTLEIYFHVPKDGDYKKAIDEITTEIDDYVKDVKVSGKGQETTLNGMPAFITSGTGVDKESGKAVGWDLTVLETAKKPVLIVSYADEAAGSKYDAQVADLVKSIRKQ